MPSPTYVALAKTVLTGTQATITFNSIPNTYTDLILLMSARQDASAYDQAIDLRFNNDSSSLYSVTTLTGTGTTTASSRTSPAAQIRLAGITAASSTSNSFSSTEIYMPNYAGNANKVVSSTTVGETNDATNNQIRLTAGLYSSTTAISRIDLITQTGNFVSGSRFDLYGIKNS